MCVGARHPSPGRRPRLASFAPTVATMPPPPLPHCPAGLSPSGPQPRPVQKLTLTNLYNARPTWLAHAHAALDRAVWAAYGWDDEDPATVPEERILERLLALNT